MNTNPRANATAATDRDAAAPPGRTARRPQPMLAVAALVLEVAALSALLIDGRHLTWIAWVPGWAGVALAVIGARANGRPRILDAVTAVLFAAGTALGILAAVR